MLDLALKPVINLYREFSRGPGAYSNRAARMVLFRSEFSFLPAKVVSAAAAAPVGVRRVP